MRLHRTGILLPASALFALLHVSAAVAGDNEECLGCHGDPSMTREASFIDADVFAATSHADLGCVACHTSVSDGHPDDTLAAEKVRCVACHDDVAREYATSPHGGYAECNDCHDPHAAHGATRLAGFDMNRKCAACHDSGEIVAGHKKWLPQAELHLGSLPCVTCHTSSENYVITFYLTRRAQAQQDHPFEGPEPASVEALRALEPQGDGRLLVDTDGDAFVSLKELRTFHTDPALGKSLRLFGMMTPERVTHSFETLDNRWDCSFCHASGPEAMQTSYVAFPENDGTYGRLPVEKGAVLDLLYGTPDFYMLGATRSRTLDIVGLAIVAGGLVMPVFHGTLRVATRNRRKEH